MAEQNYPKYIPTKAIDWGKMTSDFSQGLLDIGERRANQDIYFDSLYRENMKTVRDTEQSSDQDLNKLILGGTSQVKDNMFEMNKLVKSGKMNHNEYRNFINNTQDDWLAFANTAKTIDQTVQEGITRQNTGEDGLPQGSDFELALTGRRADLLNLRNKTLYQDPKSGKIFLARLGDEGVVTNLNDMQDVRSLDKPMNVMDNYFDFQGFIVKKVKPLAEYTVEEGDVTEKGERMNEYMARSISSAQSQIRGNSRWAYNTLNQSDERYDVYFDDEDKYAKMSGMIEIENGTRIQQGLKVMNEKETNEFKGVMDMFLVPVKKDGQGIYQPSLRAVDMDNLNKVVEDEFMSQLGYSKTLDEPKKTKGKGGGGSGGSGSGDGGYDLYEKLYDAIDSKNSDTLNIHKTTEAKNLRFEIKENGKIDVWDMSVLDVWKKPVNEGKGELKYKDKSLSDLSTWFYGKSGTTGGVKPTETYKKQRDAFYKANPSKTKIAMTEEQPEEIPNDQMASNDQGGGGFFDKILKKAAQRVSKWIPDNEQNIS